MLSVVASLTVLVDVETLLFDNPVTAETVGMLYGKEDNHAHYESKDSHCERTESLYTYAALHTIDGRIAEDTREDSAEDTANTMYRDSTYRVVNLTNLIDECH